MGQTAEQKAADAAKKAAEQQNANATELTKVKILRSHPSYGYFPGQEGELPPAKAEALIAGGFAEQA